jgi:hypothetical protein
MPTQVDPYASTNAFFNTAGFLGQQRQQGVENERNKLRDMYLGQQMDQAAAQEQRAVQVHGNAQTQFSQQQQLETLKRLNMASAEVAQNPNAIGRWGPELEKAGDLGPNWRQMSPQELQEGARKLFESTSTALRAYSQTGTGGKVKSTQILANGNVGYLTTDGRLIDTGQKAKESFQLTESGGARGVVNLRTNEFTPFSSAEEERAAASALASATVTAQEGARTAAIPARSDAEQAAERKKLQAQNATAYNTYATAIAGLQKAMDKTQTDPLTGRLPAVTAAGQTAEGAVAAMSPVLKALFRQTGEGTFTDRDQQMLLDMIPTRKDHPEARRAKIEMINQIVAAKLNMRPAGAAQSPASQAVAPPPGGVRRYNPQTGKIE